MGNFKDNIITDGYIALKEHLNYRFKALNDILKLKIKSVNKSIAEMKAAVDLASRELKERLMKMNEIRGIMEDQADQFASKTELANLDKKIDAVKEAIIDKMEGIKSRIGSIELWRAELSGMATQKSVNQATLFALIAILLSVLGIILFFLK